MGSKIYMCHLNYGVIENECNKELASAFIVVKL